MKQKLSKSAQKLPQLKFKKISKTEAQEKIKDFFSKIKDKNSDDFKKMKKLAMSHNIKLGDKRKLFCKKCLNPYRNSSINIKNDFLNITCEHCGFKNRWKLKKELDFGVHMYDDGTQGCC